MCIIYLTLGLLTPLQCIIKSIFTIDPTNVPFRDTERVVEGTDKLLKRELAQVDIQSFDAVKMKSQIDELCSVCGPKLTFKNSPSSAVEQNLRFHQRNLMKGHG